LPVYVIGGGTWPEAFGRTSGLAQSPATGGAGWLWVT
jgi:hypothetical protein